MRTCGLYSYLDGLGVLATGDEALIKDAKRAYRKSYQAKWRHENRSKNKQYDVVLTPDEAERITNAAKNHRRSATRFLKEACLAYIGRYYVVPDLVAVGAIRQELALNYDAVRGMFDENLLPQEVGMTILARIEALEQKILSQLQSPKSLEQLIAEVKRSDPGHFETLKQLIQYR